MTPNTVPMLMSLFYGYWAWQFFTAAGMTVLWAVWKVSHLEPDGALLIPIAGFFVWVGTLAMESLQEEFGEPRI